MTAFVERTCQITAGAIWTALMMGLGAVIGWIVAVSEMGVC